MDAFHDLGTCRPSSMGGIRPIPWTAIETYRLAKGIGDADRFEYLIRAMDNELLMTANRRGEDKDG